jgi:hypothetical protein
MLKLRLLSGCRFVLSTTGVFRTCCQQKITSQRRVCPAGWHPPGSSEALWAEKHNIVGVNRWNAVPILEVILLGSEDKEPPPTPARALGFPPPVFSWTWDVFAHGNAHLPNRSLQLSQIFCWASQSLGTNTGDYDNRKCVCVCLWARERERQSDRDRKRR